MAESAQLDIHSQYPTATRIEDGFAYDIKGNKLGPVNDGESNPQPSGAGFDFGFGTPEQDLSKWKPVGQPVPVTQRQEDFAGWTPVGKPVPAFDFGFGKESAQSTPPDPSLVSKAVDVLKKSVMGPNTALSTPVSPAQQQEASAVNDVIHGHFGSAFHKLSEAETPHVIQGSPLERLIKTFKPDFQGGVTPEHIRQYDAQYNPGSKPVVDVAQFIDKNESPTLKAVAETAQSFTSPETVAIMVGSGGLGLVENPAALAKTGRLLSLGFSAQALSTAYTHLKSFKEAFDKGDEKQAQYELTHALLSGTIGALAAKHGATGKQIEAVAPRDIEVAKTIASVPGKAVSAVASVPKAISDSEIVNRFVKRPETPAAQHGTPVRVESPLDGPTVGKQLGGKDLSAEALAKLQEHAGETIPVGGSAKNTLMAAVEPTVRNINELSSKMNKVVADAPPLKREPEGTDFVYRVRDRHGELGVPNESHSQATASFDEAQQYVEGRQAAQGGKPQEIIGIDLSKLDPSDYTRMSRGDLPDWIKFNRRLTEAEVSPVPNALSGKVTADLNGIKQGLPPSVRTALSQDVDAVLQDANQALDSTDAPELLEYRRKLGNQIDWDKIEKNPSTPTEVQNLARVKIYKALGNKIHAEIPETVELDKQLSPNLELRSHMRSKLGDRVVDDPHAATAEAQAEFKKGKQTVETTEHNLRAEQYWKNLKTALITAGVGASAIGGLEKIIEHLL